MTWVEDPRIVAHRAAPRDPTTFPAFAAAMFEHVDPSCHAHLDRVLSAPVEDFDGVFLPALPRALVALAMLDELEDW